MGRPAGVTVLAILNFIAAACLGLLALAVVLGIGFLGTMAGEHGRNGAILLAGLGVIGGVMFVIMAIVSAAIGYGMWNLQNWARLVSIVLCGLGIFAGLLGLTAGAVHFHPFFMMTGIVRMAVAALIIWYLFQPHVKQAFRTA